MANPSQLFPAEPGRPREPKTSNAALWARRGRDVRWLAAVSIRLATRPSLWPTALRQARHLVPVRWWETRRRLPTPPQDYLRFRSMTAYGGDGSQLPSPDDVMTWLDWTRRWRATIDRGA